MLAMSITNEVWKNDTFMISYDDTPISSSSSKEEQQPKVKLDSLKPGDITALQREVALVRSSAEMRRYTHDVVTFLRMHRAVAGGVSAVASRQLTLLSR